MQPTLLIGPADWDPRLLPREEFAARSAALFAALAPDVAGVIVHGDRARHAELAYLTHFTPELEPSAGAHERLVAGGVYSLRFGIADQSGAAIVSAIVAVGEQTNEMLWPPAPRGETR